MTEPVTIRSLDGLSIEGAVDGPADAGRALVFCHPHPQMGGTMNAPLLLALSDELVGRGWGVLRFNFRGIGSSEGESSTGEAEVADARGAVAVARERWAEASIAIAGWSFGGAVAVRTALEESELAACVTVAPAVEAKPGITAGAPEVTEGDLSLPTLVVVGANDDQVDPEACRAWAERAGASFELVPAANHFFWARYEQLGKIVADFLDDAVAS